jgi:hypothetical protein
VVEGVNVVKKHVKPNPMKGTTGGIVDKTMPIHQSNVASSTGHGQGRSRRHQDPRGRQEGARLQVQRRRDQGLVKAMTTEGKEHGSPASFYREKSRPRTDEEVRLQVGHGGAAHHQDHPEHGCERGGADKKVMDTPSAT